MKHVNLPVDGPSWFHDDSPDADEEEEEEEEVGEKKDDEHRQRGGGGGGGGGGGIVEIDGGVLGKAEDDDVELGAEPGEGTQKKGVKGFFFVVDRKTGTR